MPVVPVAVENALTTKKPALAGWSVATARSVLPPPWSMLSMKRPSPLKLVSYSPGMLWAAMPIGIAASRTERIREERFIAVLVRGLSSRTERRFKSGRFAAQPQSTAGTPASQLEPDDRHHASIRQRQRSGARTGEIELRRAGAGDRLRCAIWLRG